MYYYLYYFFLSLFDLIFFLFVFLSFFILLTLIDMGLYTKVKSILEPYNVEAQKKEQIHDSIVAKTSSRIAAKAKKKAAKGSTSTDVCEREKMGEKRRSCIDYR